MGHRGRLSEAHLAERFGRRLGRDGVEGILPRRIRLPRGRGVMDCNLSQGASYLNAASAMRGAATALDAASPGGGSEV